MLASQRHQFDIPRDIAYLNAALDFVPESEESKELRARMASIGIGPGRKSEIKDLSDAHRAAIAQGMKDGDAKVDAKLDIKMDDGNSVGDLLTTTADGLANVEAFTQNIVMGANIQFNSIEISAAGDNLSLDDVV